MAMCRRIPSVCRSGNPSSRAHPARGRRESPAAPGNPARRRADSRLRGGRTSERAKRPPLASRYSRRAFSALCTGRVARTEGKPPNYSVYRRARSATARGIAACPSPPPCSPAVRSGRVASWSSTRKSVAGAFQASGRRCRRSPGPRRPHACSGRPGTHTPPRSAFASSRYGVVFRP